MEKKKLINCFCEVDFEHRDSHSPSVRDPPTVFSDFYRQSDPGGNKYPEITSPGKKGCTGMTLRRTK